MTNDQIERLLIDRYGHLPDWERGGEDEQTLVIAVGRFKKRMVIDKKTRDIMGEQG